MEAGNQLTPPAKVSLSDPVVEQQTDPGPLEEVVHGRGRHLSSGGEDDREHDVAEEASGVSLREQPVD